MFILYHSQRCQLAKIIEAIMRIAKYNSVRPEKSHADFGQIHYKKKLQKKSF
jgi:hypothetical protein